MKVLSLHIGLNHIDPDAYGTDGELANCQNDCNAMAKIAKLKGFQSTILQDSDASCPRVTSEISNAAKVLQSGDYFFLTYAGHGSQVPDEDNEEEDGMNETWVLYDRMMIDNELYHLWSTFKAGVKIFVVSDSCHSGTLMRPFLIQVQPQLQQLPALGRALSRNLPKEKRGVSTISKDDIVRNIVTLANRDGKFDDGKSKPAGSRDPMKGLNRLLPAGNSLKNYIENRELYRTVSLLSGSKRDANVTASLLYISGCLDNQTSGDGPAGTNGLFTGKLLQVWNEDKFTGTYKDFYDRIIGLMPSDQSPNFMKLGTPNADFEKEKPYTTTVPVSSNGSTTVTSIPVTGQLTTPKLIVPSKIKISDPAPVLKADKGGNLFYYVELATDNKLFKKSDFGSNRNESNFYASYMDSSVNPQGSFLLNGTSFQIPEAVWNKLKNASKIFYRIGTASDSKWSNFRLSCIDNDYLNAPFVSVEATAIAPVPQLADTPSADDTSDTTAPAITISASVGKNGANKKPDVKIIQGLLNKVSSSEGGPEVKLIPDGLYGPKTFNAIKGFLMYWTSNETEEYIIRPDSDELNELINQSSRSLGKPPVITSKAQFEDVMM